MIKPLRALLLAAGLGTRLRPITLYTPKCLVPISREPLLGRWFRALDAIGCEAALVNTHYLAAQVNEFVKSSVTKSMRIEIVHEQSLLGTAGTLLANRKFFMNATGLLIHADNITNADLTLLLEAHRHRSSKSLLTMLTFTTENPSSCGIVEKNSDGLMTAFHEKVARPPGNCANGALYLFEPSLFDFLDDLGPELTDFSTQVLPNLVGRVQTFHTNEPYMDIGTPEALRKAQEVFKIVLGDKQ